MRLEITDLTHDARGVGRLDGKVVFVAGALPGETVEIDALRQKKRYSEANTKKIIQASKDRIQPPCPWFDRCGGCDLQHLDYAAGLLWKQKHVKGLLKKKRCSAPVHPVIGMETPWAYRNHMQLQVKNGISGFFARGSHRIVPVDSCMIQSETGNAIIRALRKLILPQGLKRIFVRTHEEQAMVGFEGAYPAGADILLKPAGVTSAWVKEKKSWKHIGGTDRFVIPLHGISFAVRPDTFFQVNTNMAQRLFDFAIENMEPVSGRNYLDLYCGIGPIGLLSAKRAGRVTGVEISETSVRMARETAKREDIHAARFLCAPSEAAAANILKKEAPEGVYLDPPRAGLDPSLIQMLTASDTRRIVYISCDPATLARDLARFSEEGWHVHGVQPFDLFPWTAHVETVVLMSRVEN